MKTAYIVSTYRSAICKAFRGPLRTKRPDELCADVIRGLLEKTPKFDPAEIDDVIVGCAMPEAEQGMNMARFAVLLAGLPDSVPGVTVNRFCSSGLQTIAMAAERIMADQADCILAGGAESMSLIPMMGNKVVAGRIMNELQPAAYLGMGMTAENVAADYKISRDEQDQFALESHQKAVKAISGGLFKNEIISVTAATRSPAPNGRVNVQEIVVNNDDGPRADTTFEALKKLKPAFLQVGGSVTAGNSSQMSDGAAMSLVCSEEFVRRNNLKPLARFAGYAVAGVPPRIMGIGPVAAIPKVCKRAGIQQKDIERFELNEAFAAQALAVIRSLDLEVSRINPTGGAIALGHPLGATGAKLTASLLHGMQRDKQKWGMVSMCIGTGMGAAGLFELL